MSDERRVTPEHRLAEPVDPKEFERQYMAIPPGWPDRSTDVAALRAQLASVTAERDAALLTLRAFRGSLSLYEVAGKMAQRADEATVTLQRAESAETARQAWQDMTRRAEAETARLRGLVAAVARTGPVLSHDLQDIDTEVCGLCKAWGDHASDCLLLRCRAEVGR